VTNEPSEPEVPEEDFYYDDDSEDIWLNEGVSSGEGESGETTPPEDTSGEGETVSPSEEGGTAPPETVPGEETSTEAGTGETQPPEGENPTSSWEEELTSGADLFS
jgi:hypothetical protein